MSTYATSPHKLTSYHSSGVVRTSNREDFNRTHPTGLSSPHPNATSHFTHTLRTGSEQRVVPQSPRTSGTRVTETLSKGDLPTSWTRVHGIPSNSSTPPPMSYWDVLASLAKQVPGLSIDFRCSDQDARCLWKALHESQTAVEEQRPGSVSPSPRNHGGFPRSPTPRQAGGLNPPHFDTPGTQPAYERREVEAFGDVIAKLRSDVNSSQQRLQRKTEEVEKLKDQLNELRCREDASEISHRNAIKVVTQKVEHLRKQLLQEESRNAKLEQRERLHLHEIDRLKTQLHKALMR